MPGLRGRFAFMDARRHGAAVAGSALTVAAATGLVFALRPVAPTLSLGVALHARRARRLRAVRARVCGRRGVRVDARVQLPVPRAGSYAHAGRRTELERARRVPRHRRRRERARRASPPSGRGGGAARARGGAALGRGRGAAARRRRSTRSGLAPSTCSPAETRLRGAGSRLRSLRSSPSREERRDAEALRRSDAIKTAMLQTVSHDFRTPLATMPAAVGGLEDARARSLRRRSSAGCSRRFGSRSRASAGWSRTCWISRGCRPARRRRILRSGRSTTCSRQALVEIVRSGADRRSSVADGPARRRASTPCRCSACS